MLTDAPTRLWPTLLVTGAAIFIFGLDSGLLSVALADIELSFPNASRATVSWTGTASSVASVAFLLIAGRVGDRFGRRRVFQAGMLGYAAGILMVSLAPSIAVLLAGRVLAGAGAALFTATGLAISLREVPAHRTAFAVGAWGTLGAIGFVLGPTGGGLIVEAAGWRTAFFVLGPIALAAAIATPLVLQESSDPETTGPISLLEVLITAVGVSSVSIALSQSRLWGWTDARVPGLLVFGTALLVVLVVRSRRDGALLDRRLLEYRGYVFATLAGVVQQLGFLSWFVTVGFVLRGVWNWSALETGYALSLGMSVAAIMNISSGRLADRWGYTGLANLGGVVAAIGSLYWVFTLQVEPNFWGAYFPGLMIFMVGVGMAGILPTGAALAEVPQELLGVANATHSTGRRLAASIGLAAMANLLGEGSGQELLDGAKAVFVMVAIAHVALIPFMLMYEKNRAGATT